MSDKFILKGKEVVQAKTLNEWAKWYETADRRVALDTKPGVTVSTVFLATNHAFGCEKPAFFETMIFGGPHDEFCERYSTWEEAEQGHKRAVEMAL